MRFPVQRLRHTEIFPLELADLRVNRSRLWEWCQTPEFVSALRQALPSLQTGHGRFFNDQPVPAEIAGFEAVYFTGGRVADAALRRRLTGLPFAVVFADNPVCAAVRGGLDWVRARAGSGWVMDLGNSQLKLATPGRQWVFPRDWTRLRMAGQVPRAHWPAQRRRLQEYLAVGLQTAQVETGQQPAALVCALPARLADDGTPAGSSYAGLKDDRTLLPEAAVLAGLEQRPVYVLNDAELAALGALTHPRLSAFGKVLFLTLGFGIGAALIHRMQAIEFQRISASLNTFPHSGQDHPGSKPAEKAGGAEGS